MGPEAAFAQAENDLAVAGIGDVVRVHGQQIAGINRRNHAAATSDEADFAEFAQDFAGQIKLNGMARGGGGGCGGSHGDWPDGHESLRLKRHCA